VGAWHKHKEINDAIEKLVAAGWTLAEQGHKYRLWCPCNEMFVRVDGSPRNPSWAARQILRQAAHCPDRHDLSGQPLRRNPK
jgi:hypothetical protein